MYVKKVVWHIHHVSTFCLHTLFLCTSYLHSLYLQTPAEDAEDEESRTIEVARFQEYRNEII